MDVLLPDRAPFNRPGLAPEDNAPYQLSLEHERTFKPAAGGTLEQMQEAEATQLQEPTPEWPTGAVPGQ
jgi:hypothetical protein